MRVKKCISKTPRLLRLPPAARYLDEDGNDWLFDIIGRDLLPNKLSRSTWSCCIIWLTNDFFAAFGFILVPCIINSVQNFGNLFSFHLMLIWAVVFG